MQYEVKLYVGGNVFYERMIANNPCQAKRVALIRNPNAKIMGFTVIL